MSDTGLFESMSDSQPSTVSLGQSLEIQTLLTQVVMQQKEPETVDIDIWAERLTASVTDMTD